MYYNKGGNRKLDLYLYGDKSKLVNEELHLKSSSGEQPCYKSVQSQLVSKKSQSKQGKHLSEKGIYNWNKYP